MNQFKPGVQVAYIPHHAGGDIDHKDVEYGFITGASKDHNYLFCRFWRQGYPGQLRTTSCSKATPVVNLQLFKTVRQPIVDQMMISLGYMHNPKKEKVR